MLMRSQMLWRNGFKTDLCMRQLIEFHSRMLSAVVICSLFLGLFSSRTVNMDV